jgi:hypothetical protein
LERLPLDRLIVSQHGLRCPGAELRGMMEFVAGGGLWTEAALRAHAARHGLPPPSPIRLSQFPDALVVHDGHHRLVATYLAGRDFLDPAEYRVTRWTYEQYLEINFACGWVTPFDPRTHVRIADFAGWKRRVLELARADLARAAEMIRSQPWGYREPRRYAALADLARECFARGRPGGGA